MTDTKAPPPRRPGRRHRQVLRRVSGVAALVLSLAAIGTIYAALAPHGDAAPASDAALTVRKGQQLFDQTCITCHGANLQGVKNRGPSLIGVGAASVYFQVRTGRMPLAMQGAQADPHPAKFDEAQTEQIAAYVQAHGGGPTVPSGNLRGGDIGAGGELFRLNCASCHNLAGKGGALSSGKSAPGLGGASDSVIYAAMLSGPESMPVFGDNQITPSQKREIITYIQNVKNEADAGGTGIGRLGPVPEGLVIWVVGIIGLLFIVFWIGAKS